jgi:predicted MFS family arabinose efflux permease
LTLALAVLTLAYVLSQFYRAFLAVLAPTLQAELGVGADGLAAVSGIWFLTFAAMQLPVGMALDRWGPRWTAAILLAAGGGGGALVFAGATGQTDLMVAMGLIGIGCSPVLMASYYLIARNLTPARFGTVAGAVLGVGLLGNVLSASPLALAVAWMGWRAALVALAVVTLAAAGLIALVVRDPPRVTAAHGAGSLRGLFAMPALWPIMVMMAVCYMPVAALRGFWLGPFYAQVIGADAAAIGQVALWMGLAMVAGSLAMGPLERLTGTRKWLVLAVNLGVGLAVLALWAVGARGGAVTAGLFVAVGLLGGSFAMVLAHGRAFIPAHLTGRGVTLLNMCGIASVGLAQVVTGRLFAAWPGDPAGGFAAVFLAIAVVTLAGCAVYALSQDRTD